MSPKRLEEFLAQSRLLESEKDEVRNSKEVNVEYQKIIFWHDFVEVHKLYRDFHSYLKKNRITTKDEKCRTAATAGFHAGEGAGATFSYKAKGLDSSVAYRLPQNDKQRRPSLRLK